MTSIKEVLQSERKVEMTAEDREAVLDRLLETLDNDE